MKTLIVAATLIAAAGCSSSPAGNQAFVTTPQNSATELGSCANPIAIEALSADGGAHAEDAFIGLKYPGATRVRSRSATCKGHSADRVVIRTADGKKVRLYFDSSRWSGSH